MRNEDLAPPRLHPHTAPPPRAPKLSSSQLGVKLTFVVYIYVCVNGINWTMYYSMIPLPLM